MAVRQNHRLPPEPRARTQEDGPGPKDLAPPQNQPNEETKEGMDRFYRIERNRRRKLCAEPTAPLERG
jgi:hypothetical protein